MDYNYANPDFVFLTYSGGSILLSGDGICVIPDLHCYKKQKMNLLLQGIYITVNSVQLEY